MIKRMEIKGVHFTIEEKLHKYVENKLGGLDRFMSRHTRDSAHMEVTLKELKQKSGRQLCCSVSLHLPQENIMVTESTVNIYAAIDIAEAKLKMQLKKYKETHEQGKLRRKLFGRRRNRTADLPAAEA